MIGEHSFRRMFEREILPDDVLDVVRNGEIIKEYPEDKPYPSFLILKFVNYRPIHVVIAKNAVNDLCFVVTVYEPDPETWSKDFKTKLYE
ncbi:MAG: DUF4258 domain-containing protein [Bacteroidetes bacterium]|nr:DUF4258 domain-containing protein [Bacteroidota bacterium]MBS1930196.1 DUF4258 domain-containing protein [Bacteroidota bacterium]